MKKLISILKLQDKYGIMVKLALISVFIFVGFFYNPFMYVAFAICCFFILIENNVNSFYLIGYTLSFMNVFSFNNEYGFTFFNLLVLFYVVVIGIKTLVLFFKKELKFDLKLLIPFLILVIYYSIPFTPKYKILSVLEIYVWLALFYLLIVNRKSINKLNLLYAFCAGIIVSSLFGIFRAFIPTLTKAIPIYYLRNHARFSSLFSNPNILYETCITAAVLIYVLIYNDKINYKYMFLCVPLLVFGNATLSKTYFVILIIFFTFVFFNTIIKRNKEKTKKFLAFLTTILLSLCLFALFNFVIVDKVVNNQVVNQQITTDTNINNPDSSLTDKDNINDNLDDQTTKQEPTIINTNNIFNGRLDIWKHFLCELFDNKVALFFGFGINTANGYYSLNSHNTYIQVLFETGILGCILLIACIIYLFWYFKFSFKKNWSTMSLLPLSIFLIYCMTENQFFSQLGNILLIFSVMFLVFDEEKKKDINFEKLDKKENEVKINNDIKNKIPKIIHYIWLGGKPLPKVAKKCIKSWEKFCPDFEIKRWDESNLDLNYCNYIKQALELKKYAFAADVFRFDILKKEGGIYLDIDVEIIKPIDNLLKNRCVLGFENDKSIAPGLILASEPNHPFINEVLEYYKKSKFDCSDPTKMVTICAITTDILKTYGLEINNQNQNLKSGICVYSSEYFCPKSTSDGKIRTTENTYSIHHYLSSWTPLRYRIKNKLIQLVKRIIGPKMVQKLKNRKSKQKYSKGKVSSNDSDCNSDSNI